MMKGARPRCKPRPLRGDKRLLDATGIDADTPLEVSTDGQVIIVSPVRDRRRAARLRKIVAEAHREYGRVFKRLADS